MGAAATTRLLGAISSATRAGNPPGRTHGHYARRMALAQLTRSTPGALPELRFDRAELAGAVADLGVLVPIAVALIVSNGLSATAVLVPAGLLYVFVGLYYRVPVGVQPLKAFGAIAIAAGVGAAEIAAGALLMGAVFLLLGYTRTLDRAAALFPRPVIRGVQLSVGLLLGTLAWGLLTSPPAAFAGSDLPAGWLVAAGVAVAGMAFALRGRGITLALVALAGGIAVATYDGPWTLGPSELALPSLDAAAFATAAVVLVVPQLPLTFANSCVATADAARTYFGPAAHRVQPGRLGMSLGTANLLAGSLGGMPVCHGAGGMTAHRAFGARTGAAPLVLGSLLIALALGAGTILGPLLGGFPVPVLAGLLAVAGAMHIALLRDLEGPVEWLLAIGIGVAAVLGGLALALAGGLVLWWCGRAVRSHVASRAGK